MITYLFDHWDQLPSLIARCWAVERVEEYVAEADKSRMDLLHEALDKPCVCDGQWLAFALKLLELNGISREVWTKSMLDSLEHGRRKGSLVTHAGLVGNESKSFLFTGLEAVHPDVRTPTSKLAVRSC